MQDCWGAQIAVGASWRLQLHSEKHTTDLPQKPVWLLRLREPDHSNGCRVSQQCFGSVGISRVYGSRSRV